MDTKPQCGDCKFWEKGLCKAHPRQFAGVHVTDEVLIDVRWYYPEQSEDDWCGEFQGRGNEE